MKPILPSRPNHSWLRRRLRDAMRTGLLRGWSSGLTNSALCYAEKEARVNRLDLEGRHAVVTGGAAGIGFAIAQRLAASGARVSIWDRDEAALAKARDGLGEAT